MTSSSMVLCPSIFLISGRVCYGSASNFRSSSNAVVPLIKGRTRARGLVPNVKKGHSKKRSWWQKLFLDDDGSWIGLNDEDMIDASPEGSSSDDDELSEVQKFEEWKRRAEAIIELREAQEDMKNEESRRWEDWIVDETSNGNGSWDRDWTNRSREPGEDVVDAGSNEIVSKRRGFVDLVKDTVFGKQDDDILYEDRVFQYASMNSAKFLAVLLIVPSVLDCVVHDYVLMPFLDRYVKTVPLAAEFFDVRRSQKLEMVKELDVKRARYRLEVEIGKSPPLSDEELWLELRHKALELRDEWRLNNRKAFASIWSDVVFGISLFLLLYFNQNKVALLKFTGYKLINNISDSGKAFLIILITDIFLGYHSEAGWHTVIEIFLEHYGFEVDQSAITIFVCLVPVTIDGLVKLWLFKFLPRLSPGVANIFRKMQRH